MVLIRLRRCAGRSAPLFAYEINRFSHDVTHLIHELPARKTENFQAFLTSILRGEVAELGEILGRHASLGRRIDDQTEVTPEKENKVTFQSYRIDIPAFRCVFVS